MKNAITLLMYITIGFVINYLGYGLLYFSPEYGGNFLIVTKTLSRPIILFAALLIGIICKEIFEVLSCQSEHLSYGKLFKHICTPKLFVKSIIISPIIFNAIYGIVRENPDTTTAMLLSFQNGFFWQAILNPSKK